MSFHNYIAVFECINRDCLTITLVAEKHLKVLRVYSFHDSSVSVADLPTVMLLYLPIYVSTHKLFK